MRPRGGLASHGTAAASHELQPATNPSFAPYSPVAVPCRLHNPNVNVNYRGRLKTVLRANNSDTLYLLKLLRNFAEARKHFFKNSVTDIFYL